MLVSFQLQGATSILFHADDIDASDELKEWRDDPANRDVSVRGDDRSPAWTWQSYLYSDGKHLAWPSANIMVALRGAGSQMTLKKNKTLKEITQNGLLIAQEYLKFTVGGKQLEMTEISSLRDMTYKAQADAVKDLGFSLFAKRAKVGQAKHVRVRARFDEWEIGGEIEIMPHAKDVITYERLQELFLLASRLGQGDWRPGCKTPGPYGTFNVKLKVVAK